MQWSSCGMAALGFQIVIALLNTGLLDAGSPEPKHLSFENAKIGGLPEGWSAAKTGRGPGSVWRVVEDATAPEGPKVLAQTSAEGRGGFFNLCVADDTSYADLDVRLALKATAGDEDQGGGPVWRYKDANNYYVARMNPLEDNYRVYKVVGGKRTQLGSADVKAPAGQWHTLRIVHKGDQFQCYLNDKLFLDVKDDTFKDAGKVGLWTKADAQTRFAALKITMESNPAEAADHDNPLLWEATRTSEAPVIDGKAEALWDKATPVTVTVRKAMGGHKSKSVILRALYTKDALCVLAQWLDATRSDMRDPYVWNQTRRVYERPTKPDDQFALEFPIKGDFDINMLAMGRNYTADVWHWKAGRGNPVGWVDDKSHIISKTPVPKAQEYTLGQHAKVFIARLMDAGTSSYREVPLPETFRGDVVDSYEPRVPNGSLADVRGKGLHDGKGWTLEMTRRFDTEHDDDAVLDPAKPIPCAIAVLDDELYWQHYVSPPITLTFQQGGR